VKEKQYNYFGLFEIGKISMKEVTDQLEQEGVKAFADSYFALLDEISKRRDRIQAGK